MKRPLLIVALAYVGGVLVGDRFTLPLGLLFAPSFLLVSLAVGWPRARPYLLWLLVPLVGCTNLTTRSAVLSPYDLRTLIGEQVEYVTLSGHLLETPEYRFFER